jgi:isocitrate dehydrogenase
VQQFVKENHLRWDSLGEFLALGPAFELAGAQVLADTLDEAIGRFLEENRSPSRKVGELDNRGSHFYLTLYWAQALANCSDEEMAAKFAGLAETLAAKEAQIVEELNAVQGSEVDLGGYYRPDIAKAAAAMRPSDTFNKAIETLG